MPRLSLRLLLVGFAFLVPLLVRATPPGRVVAWGAGGPGTSGYPHVGQSTVPAAALGDVIAIAAGDDFSVALKDNGTVTVWGQTSTGQSLAVPAGISGITAIAASETSSHILALRGDGTVAAWGENTSGQVTGTPSPGLAVATTVTQGGQALSGVVGMATGDAFSVAVKSDGTVVAWGSNFLGQTNVPAGLNGAIAVAAGMYHGLALKSDGSVVAWGDNTSGQTNVPASLSNVVAIAAGGHHSLALKSDGTVVAWGVSAGIPAGLAGVVAIAAGPSHNFALKNDGTLAVWSSYDNYGETMIPPAAQGCVLAIAAGGFHSLALVTEPVTLLAQPAHQVRPAGQTAIFTVTAGGTPPYVYRWYKDGAPLSDGGNISGATTASLTVAALGSADAGDYTVEVGNAACAPAALSDPAVLTVLAATPPGRVLAWGDDTFGQCTVPASAAFGVVAVSAGQGHTLALKSTGQLIAWGWNSSGQTNVPLATLNGSVAIAAGQAHSLALRNDGIVLAWGNNAEGQTGVPAGLNGVVAVAAGGSHSVALKHDGSVVAWGHNGFGQSSVPPGLGGVIAISAGMYHTLALKADGTVAAWGDNSQGQSTVPAGLSDVVMVAAGFYHSTALRADGSVVAWGAGTIGTGPAPHLGQSLVPADLGDGTALAAGRYHTVALKNDQTLRAWGDDGSGQSTVLPAAQGRALAVAAGWLHTVAIVRRSPILVAGPLNAYVNLGREVDLTVSVEGTPPLGYQWRRQSAMGASDIPGATAPTLRIGGAQPSQAGQYTVVVSNVEGTATGTATVTVLPATTYSQWRESRFTAAELADPAVSGPLADPQGEGLPNLLRYALKFESSAGGASAPGAGTPGWPLVPTLSESDGKLTLLFQALRTDLAYGVEASTDLISWSPAGVTVENNGTLHTARFAAPPGTRAFLRVVVTPP